MSYIPKRRKEDKPLWRVGTFFQRFFIVIGIAATISTIMVLSTLTKLANYVPPALPDKILLTYTFKSSLAETIGKPSLDQPLLRPATTLHEIVDALHNGAKDKRVTGFVARLQGMSLEPAHIQELRDAVHQFRKAGKFAHIYSDSFGGFSSGMGDYYLASAFDEIWLQPVGLVAINGIAAEVPFFKDLFDKVGVRAEFNHKGKYKSAPESLTETGMSAAHREMMESLIGDLSGQIVAGIAADRGMTEAGVRALIDGAPYNDADALSKKLIDKIGYYDQLLAAAKKKADVGDDGVADITKYTFVSDTIEINKGMAGFVSKFLRKEDPASSHKDKAKIALIYGAGEIISFGGKSKSGFGETGMAADKIVAAFHATMKDEDVAAVVFRVDSPGGSPEAAESIHRAIQQTRQKGKPVIVSMSGSAASGGYWIAAGADKIVAQPATITGSIGVFGGKIEFSQLWSKIGVNWESVAEGRNARMWSSNKPFTENERAQFESVLDNIYAAFLARVAEGRGMSRDAVAAVAEGRVWTGRQAKEVGLVDELGGLDVALKLAKQLALLPEEQPVPVVNFPPRKSTFELFMELATDGSAFFAPRFEISMEDVLQSLTAEMQGHILKMPGTGTRF